MSHPTVPILIADRDAAGAQQLAAQLATQGYEVEVVADGQQALSCLSRRRFAAVVVDVHLPIVGGIDVTRMARETEANSGRYTPIVGVIEPGDGLTRRSLTALGMDHVLLQPLAAEDLTQVLGRLVSRAEAQAPTNPETHREDASMSTENLPAGCAQTPNAAAGTPKIENCLDDGKLAEFLEGDPKLFVEMVDLLLEEYPKRMTQIAQAIDGQDAPSLERGAHSLKGALSYFCQSVVIEKLQALENCGHDRNFADAAPLSSCLEGAYPRLARELIARRPVTSAA